jgi:hypothetical protein
MKHKIGRRLEILIDSHSNILFGVFAFLVLGAQGSLLTSQKIISVFVDLQFGDDAIRRMDRNVDGST